MNEFPLVTVITPAYNRADYLVETIESVLNQDYPNLEYIVLDDGSKDNTKEILELYRSRLTYVDQPNMGETRTVNKGFGLARGEIIVVVNSDDPLLPGAISSAVTFLEENPDITVAYPDWIKIDNNSELIEQVCVPDYDYIYMLRQHHCIVGPGAFINRRAFDFIGFRDPKFKYVADFDFWLRLGLYCKFARIPITLATFREHQDSASVSHKGTEMGDEHIILIKKIFTLANLPPEAKKIKNEAISWAHYVASEMCEDGSLAAFRHKIFALFYSPRVQLTRYLIKIRMRSDRYNKS